MALGSLLEGESKGSCDLQKLPKFPVAPRGFHGSPTPPPSSPPVTLGHTPKKGIGIRAASLAAKSTGGLAKFESVKQQIMF